MNHTIQEIIDNQEKFKEEIMNWFRSDIQQTKNNLKEIKTQDQFIQKEKTKLIRKFEKLNFLKHFSKLFFMHSTRNKEYYVWWDKDNQEALILRYVKK